MSDRISQVWMVAIGETLLEERISIVIPTYNRCYLLREILPSYVQQVSVGEIIIVDDGGQDSTQEVTQAMGQASPVPLRYIRHEKRQGPAAARNSGAKNASYSLILYGEDDVLLADGYAETLARRRRALGVELIAGRIIYMTDGETTDDAQRRYESWPAQSSGYFQHRFGELNPHARVAGELDIPFVHSIFLTFTDHIKQIRFDEHYRGNAYREESDFQMSLRSLGGRIMITDAATCFHLPRSLASVGGHHGRNWLAYEFWTIHNNNYFVHKHYATLRTHLGWEHTETRAKWDFAVYRWQEWIRPRLGYEVRRAFKPYIPKRLLKLLSNRQESCR